MLTGGSDADSFSCGPGTDTITNFNEAEGTPKLQIVRNHYMTSLPQMMIMLLLVISLLLVMRQ